MKLLVDISGWLGSGLLIIAFAISSLQGQKYIRYAKYLNLFGGIMIAVNCYYYNALPSFASNIIWCIIATFTIYKTKKRQFSKIRAQYFPRKRSG
ncbi:hypothetical protein ACFSKL_02125 [Belliella marina]|uniref:CBU-0592-like domain-containing protein n=1 Tax=Belliella marina TaxID=1644146 RepID=A0ABW4VHT5_9BACT